jgi:hypothetical protein
VHYSHCIRRANECSTTRMHSCMNAGKAAIAALDCCANRIACAIVVPAVARSSARSPPPPPRVHVYVRIYVHCSKQHYCIYMVGAQRGKIPHSNARVCVHGSRPLAEVSRQTQIQNLCSYDSSGVMVCVKFSMSVLIIIDKKLLT